MSYKLGSLFDGSGGFPLAGSLCGITPAWASEVEPYPIAVTRSRFPAMKHLGDISKINGAEIEPVDIITFGSPCQDLSVAGKRAGLKHEANGDDETTRSGLFMEAVRIIKEMRAATNGVHPRFAIWENVPGAFSSNKGEDFRIVLQELIQIVEPDAVMPPVPEKGWAYADSYCCDGWSLAYRVLDAQFWGVPQRRRRIYLVVDFADGAGARKVLFERPGLRGYFAEGRTPWQGTAGGVEGGAGAADFDRKCVIGLDCYNQSLTGDKAKSITGADTDSDHIPCVLSTEYHCYAMQAFGKYTESNIASAMKARDYKDATDLIVECASVDCRNFKEYPELYPTLQAKPNGGQSLNFSGCVRVRYIVRRCTPTECARLQGFADRWGDIDKKDSFTDEEYSFWCDVYLTKLLIDGKVRYNDDGDLIYTKRGTLYKPLTKAQLLTWYNKLLTDSSEYKMWGNGIALPTALYCMQGIADALEEVTRMDEGKGWRGIGPEAGKFVQAADGFRHAAQECGITMVDPAAPLADEFNEMLVEWYFSGNWIEADEKEE